jgi:hypothetical protein
LAFVAVTAKVDEPPGAIEVGLALMPAVGAAVVALNLPPPHPPSNISSNEQGITEKGILLKSWRTAGAVKVSSLLSPEGACLPVAPPQKNQAQPSSNVSSVHFAHHDVS